MCGIAGILLYPKNRTESQLQYIRELATELAIENQKRGNHATGIATFQVNGENDVLKHNLPADEMTTYDTWYNFINKNIGHNTTNILIHTRFATQGKPENNDNNHPIVTASAIGIHNGMIYNDDSLFNKEKLFRQAEVDSEVIFRLVDKEFDNERENAKNVAEKITGVYAVAYVRKDEPTKLNYFRNNNPTTFVYIPELNIIVFASIKGYIESAMETANISNEYLTRYYVETNNLVWFEPKQDIVMQFDVSENTPIDQLEQTPLYFEENNSGWYGRYGNYNYYDDGWYDDFRDERTGYRSAEGYDDNDTIDNVYDFLEKKNIEHLMSDEDFASLIGLLDQLEKSEWSSGYKAGRMSFENEREMLREQAMVKKVSTDLAN